MDTRVSGFITFHSLCLSFCEAERDFFPFKVGPQALALEPLCNKIASDIARKYELNFRQLRSWISLQKRTGVRPKQALQIAEKEGKNEKLALAYKAYDQGLLKNEQLDFDSILLESVTLLKSNPAVRARWQYDWLLVDEAQDCNRLQFDLIRCLSERSGNVFMVGDGGQGIFGFTGAEATGFMEYPGTRLLYMGKNHRSDGKIVEFLKEIGPLRDLAERFHTDNPDGLAPVITGYPSAVDEAKAVVAYVQAHPKTTVAVLSRTNAGLRVFEDTLATSGIRYRLMSKSGFWAQSEVKTAVAYLTCCQYPSDYALKMCLGSAARPTKYLKRKELLDTLKKQQAANPDLSLWSLLGTHRASDPHQGKAITDFIQYIHSLRRYKDQPPKTALASIIQTLHQDTEDTPDNSPTENLAELQRIAGRFTGIKEFVLYAHKASAASKSKNGVILGTCHASKGSEFHTVFLTGVTDGVLPHAKAEDPQEEWRIFFVGCSRAEKELYISYAGIPSPFLKPYLKTEEQLLEEVFA